MARRPTDLSAPEGKRWQKLVKDMREAGVDTAGKQELMESFVRAETRLVALRKTEGGARSVTHRLRANRAAVAAEEERRKLHKQLFRGGKIEPEPAIVEERPKEKAWRNYLYRKTGNADQIEREHGPAGWSALLYETHEEELACKVSPINGLGHPD